MELSLDHGKDEQVWANLFVDCSTQLGNQGQLMLFSVALEKLI